MTKLFAFKKVDGKGAKGFHEVIMDEIQDMKRSLAAKVKMNEFLFFLKKNI